MLNYKTMEFLVLLQSLQISKLLLISVYLW